MRLAIAGKGGAGKTTISATAARLAARTGMRVVAVDADSSPNLGAALGHAASNQGATTPTLPPSLVSRRLDGAGFLQPVDEVLAEHAIEAPDGVQLIAMGSPGHAEEGCLCSAHAVISTLLAELGDRQGTLTVVDMEASPEHLSRGTARHADILLLVAEPYYRALEAVRRLGELARELPIPRVAVVANKIRSAADHEAISAYCERHGLEQVATVAWSEDVLAADRSGRSVLDAAPESSLVHSVDELLLNIGAR